MAFDYSSLLVNTVQPLLAQFGKPGVLLIPGAATSGEPYDPQPAADTEQAITAVQTAWTKEEMARGNVEVGDVSFIASPEGVATDPSLAQRLTISGTEYQVIGIKPLAPGPVTMFWKVHARK